jgi:hypothetical protein
VQLAGHDYRRLDRDRSLLRAHRPFVGHDACRRYWYRVTVLALSGDAGKAKARIGEHRRVNDGGARDVLWRPGANR